MAPTNLPYRSGLVTLRTVCRTIIRIWSKFRPIVINYLDAADVKIVDDLMSCAELTVELVNRLREDV